MDGYRLIIRMLFTEGLRKNADFRTVYQYGKSASNYALVMYVCSREDDRNRIGFSVSKKVGNSVVRHRLKRLMKESYRLNETKFARGLDIVVIARPGAREITFPETERALLRLAQRLEVRIENNGQAGR